MNLSERNHRFTVVFFFDFRYNVLCMFNYKNKTETGDFSFEKISIK